MLELKLRLLSAFLLLGSIESRCRRGCDLALGSYSVSAGDELDRISNRFNRTTDDVLKYNPQILKKDSLPFGIRINFPFTCDCIDGQFLGHVFRYDVQSRDTYDVVATERYANLTTADWLQRFNSYDPNRIPDTNASLNVTVNCSCGNPEVSRDYGLFITYPLRPGETIDSIAAGANLSSSLLERYNPGVNFSAGSGLVYIPGRDQNRNYPPLPTSSGLSGGAIAGISIAAVVGVIFLAGCLYFGLYKRKKSPDAATLLKTASEAQPMQAISGTLGQTSDSSGVSGSATPGLTGITIDKSVEFSYEELAKATNDFSIANKIGQGGFGAVYYAELRGEKAAIKKMDMQASREFLAELKVLTEPTAERNRSFVFSSTEPTEIENRRKMSDSRV